jgi:two-component sensor histidine kinase
MDHKKLQENHFHLNRKLIGVVVVFILAASGLAVLTNFAINMTAAAGDYSLVLSKWSQYHYQAGIHVERFVRTGDEEALQAYHNTIAQKDSIKQGVGELLKKEPDVGFIFQTFGNQSIYPNEISGLLYVFEYFGSTKIVHEMRRQWELLVQIENHQLALIDILKRLRNEENPREAALQERLNQYNELNEQWNNHNAKLTDTVRNASATVKQFGLWMSVILGILLVLIGVVFTVRANKSIGRWEDSLHEKEVLLTEIHHRVKNNLAVISGLLELESMGNTEPKKALKDSRDRINSMAIIHKILYQSASFSNINVSSYLNELTDHICTTYARPNQQIKLQTQFEDVQLNMNQAVPVGLIVNEILANAFEHGFEQTDSGIIKISLHQSGESICLIIEDNGKGAAKEIRKITSISSGSTGSAIVGALTQQLSAELNIENTDGIKISLKFRKSDAAGSSNAQL